MAFQIKKFNSIVASMINWVSSNTTKITDFNIGSVTRTILEAVALELEELYYQLLKAVEEAIEEAIYRTFNFPRNPSVKSTGLIRFTRATGSTMLISIPRLTLVSTTASPPTYFETQADDYIPSFTGIATGGSDSTLVDNAVDFVAAGVVNGSIVIDNTDGGQTQTEGVINVDTHTLTFGPLTTGSFAAGKAYTVIVPYKDISVQAQIAGTGGNVVANSITALKTVISNIETVTNQFVFGDGRDEETDLERKARFALYIQSLTRATKGALEYAARSVPQIVAAKAIDDVRATIFKAKYTTGDPTLMTSYTLTDITAYMRNPGDAAIDLFDSPTTNDALCIGASEIFEYVNMHIAVDGILSGVIGTKPAWKYWNGLSWALLSTTTHYVDGTDNAGAGPLTQSGTLKYDAPSDWVAATITYNDVSYNLLWLKLEIIDETYTTIPTGDWCSLPPGFGYVNLYCHDGSGELNSTLQLSVKNAVDLYRGCGIIVEVLEPTKYTPHITVELLIASNYDSSTLAITAKQAIMDWMNAKSLGQDVYIASIYQLIMDFNNKAILNTNITECSMSGGGGVQDLIIPSSAVVRPDTSYITVTATTI